MNFFKGKALVPVALLAVALLAAAAYFFQPWKLFIDTEVQEAIPTVTATSSETSSASLKETEAPSEVIPTVTATSSETSSASPKETEAPSEVIQYPLVLVEGVLVSHEHQTSGAVKILQLEDGSRVLRLENLDTSDGPRVEVWLTDAPVIEGEEGWRVFDDGKYTSLGAMKGNQGNQNYEIPPDLDLLDFSSISLWCVTFSVSFGAAELLPTS
jgi:hypothetical protein